MAGLSIGTTGRWRGSRQATQSDAGMRLSFDGEGRRSALSA